MGVAFGHAECHMALFQDWGRCGYGGLCNTGGVRPSSPFIECLGKRQLWVQNACSVTPEVDRK